jgi:23S rRNA pseudouridine2605 synthase
MQERLQKIIARAGLASRRHAEELIKSGLVTVNGKTVTELGSKADEATDHIKVSGKLLRPETERVYMILNKPPEVVSTMSDPEGRRALSDLLGGVSQRVFPVGRLEYHAMGLVFLTNDGELANLLLKSHHLPQTYELKLKSLLTFQETENFARVTGAHISRLKGRDAPWYEVTISDARRDALRNRLFQTGHPVEKTKRIKLANIALDALPPGTHRLLSDAEVNTLRKSLVAADVPTPAPLPEADASDAQPTAAQMAAPRAGAPLRPVLVASRAERRPQIKRFFKAKPKPGQGPKTFGDRPPRPFGDRPPQSFDRPGAGAPSGRPDGPRPSFGNKPFGNKPFGKKPFGADRPFRANKPFAAGGGAGKPFRNDRPGGSKPFGSDRPNREGGKSFGGGDRPFRSKPSGDRSFGGGRPSGGRPSGDRPDRGAGKSFGGGGRSFGGGKPSGDRPYGDRPRGDRPSGDRKSFGGPRSGKPGGSYGKPGRFPKKTFGGDRAPREGQAASGPKPFYEKKSFGGKRSFGDKPSGPPREGGRPSGPGNFGKPKSFGKFGKGPKPDGARGPKRSGPGGSSRPPKPGGFRGPRKSS